LPTVSRNISELEAHLSTSLFVRSRKGLQMTEAGRGYVAAAKAILESVTEAERAAAGEYTAPTGDLVVAAPIVFGRYHALPVISEFLAAYPAVTLRLVQSDRNIHLIEDHVDVALRIGELPDSTLTATTLGFVRQVVCAGPKYLAQNGAPHVPGELVRHNCITSEAFGTSDAWLFRNGKTPIEVRVQSRLVVNTLEAAIDAAIANGGFTRALSYQVAGPVRSGKLTIVLADFERPAWPVHLLYNGQSRLPLKLRAFVDFAAPRLRQRLIDARLPPA
jgi:DNA-binding transcriptional LysR family regulator